MQTTLDLVTVAFRELGEGGLWCCGAGEPEPAAQLSCDIRQARLLCQAATTMPRAQARQQVDCANFVSAGGFSLGDALERRVDRP